jgi:hypothetical protein
MYLYFYGDISVAVQILAIVLVPNAVQKKFFLCCCLKLQFVFMFMLHFVSVTI